MITILFCSLIVYCIYHFLIKPQLFWKFKHVKQGWPIPIFGDNWTVLLKLESMTEFVQRVYNKFKDERYFGLYLGRMRVLVINDLELVKQIGVRDFDHFENHSKHDIINEDDIYKNNLFFSTGNEWRQLRAMFSPAFTSSRTRQMFGLIQNCAQQYVDFYLAQNEELIKVELRNSCSRYILNVIATTLFGIDSNALTEPNNAFYTHGMILAGFAGFGTKVKQFIIMLFPQLSKILRIQLFSPEFTNYFITLGKNTIKMREDLKIVRPDLIQLFMKLGSEKLENEEIAAQVIFFIFAGLDTTLVTLNFTCYELARNPDIQEKLRKEIDETLAKSQGKFTYESIKEMKYLDMVICEALRKDSPPVFLHRLCNKQYTIQPERPDEHPVTINEGQIVWLPVRGLHHDESLYPNPEKFDPERFSVENKKNINPYAYLPFGVGPRTCIGLRFALIEMKIFLCYIMNKFELVVVEKTTIPIKYDRNSFATTIKGGFWIGLKRRYNATNTQIN